MTNPNHNSQNMLPDGLASAEISIREFDISGINTSETIRQLTAINGIPIATLEQDLQPNSKSNAGFLGEEESLTDVLAEDNDTVLSQGLTHQQVAEPLKYIDAIFESGEGNFRESRSVASGIETELEIAGAPYLLTKVSYRGYQESPFRDGTRTLYDVRVLNTSTGHAFQASGLMGEMIDRYGFYEGHGTPYRVEPQDIIDTFTHLRRIDMSGDPVVEAAAGLASNVVLTSQDQVNRLSNLRETGIPAVQSTEITVRPATAEDVIRYLREEKNASLDAALDVSKAIESAPATIVLGEYESLEPLLANLSKQPDEVQEAVIDCIDRIDDSEQSPWGGSDELSHIIAAGVKDQDGEFVTLPIARLVDKLPHSPTGMLRAFTDIATNQQKDFNEARARAYARTYGSEIMDFVKNISTVDESLPIEDQVIVFLKK